MTAMTLAIKPESPRKFISDRPDNLPNGYVRSNFPGRPFVNDLPLGFDRKPIWNMLLGKFMPVKRPFAGRGCPYLVKDLSESDHVILH